MKEWSRVVYVLASLVAVSMTGCAAAYHSYSGCRVNCKYCPPPALPYSQYASCACHSCQTSNYLSRQPESFEVKR